MVDGDEDMEQDEQPVNGMESVAPGTRAPTAPQEETQPLSPKPQLLLGSTNDTGMDNTMDGLDASLNPLTTVDGKEDGMELDLSGLPHVDAELVGGPLLDQADNPFVQ